MSTDPEVTGVIEETLPGGLYRVQTENGRAVTASIATEARRFTVRIVPGDKVTVRLFSFDPTRGRITLRQP